MTQLLLTASPRSALLRASIAAAVVGICLVAGAATVYNPLLTGVFVVFFFIWAAVVSDWRRGITWLLVFLPFTGLPVFFIGGRFSLLVKDLAIVLPLYVGFAAWLVLGGRRSLPSAKPIARLGLLFTVLALAYVAASPTLLVGAIGAKVWLAYLPLLPIGYCFLRDRGDLVRVLRLTTLIALVPASVGLIEFLFAVSTGGFGRLVHLYGSQTAITANQVVFGTVIPRIPSTFASPAGYYNFTLVALAASLALWGLERTRRSASIAMLFAAAGLTCGTRRAYFTVPLLILLSLALGSNHLTRFRALVGAALVMTVLIAANGKIATVVRNLPAGTASTFHAIVRVEFLPALGNSAIGHGTGSDTNAAAEHGNLNSASFNWREGWYTKALIELGISGLVLIVLLLASLLRAGLRAVRAVPLEARGAGAPLLAMLAVTCLTLIKASELDWDPMNAYFWLMAGFLLAIPRLWTGQED